MGKRSTTPLNVVQTQTIFKRLIGHFEVARETRSRVLLDCIEGLFWGRATVYAVVYSTKQKDFRIFL